MKFRTWNRAAHGPYVLSEGIVAVVLLLALIVASPSAGQMREFGYVEATYREAFEAGIHGFNIVRNGPEGNLSECVFTVEVFGEGQKSLGVSEVKFPTLGTSRMTHVMPDGETYHTTYDEDSRVYTFEHVGGDQFRRQELCDLDYLDEDWKTYQDAEEAALLREDREAMIRLKKYDLEELIKRQNECLEQVELTGNTSKTFEQLLSDHAEISSILQSVGTELHRIFEIPSKRERERRALALEQSRAGSQSGLVLCGEGEEQFCDTDPIRSLSADGECSGDDCNQSVCCSDASAAADARCLRFTGLTCCANSLCRVTSIFCGGLGTSCRCVVNGFRFDCRSTCV